MAELPELEVLKDTLTRMYVGKRLLSATVHLPVILKTVEPGLSSIANNVLKGVGRIGKHLVFQWDSGIFLVTHLMLTGWMKACDSKTGLSKFDEFVFSWQDGQDLRIYEAGQQRMAAVYIVSDPKQAPSVAKAGIDPMNSDFTEDILVRLLQGRRMTLKTFLTDQKILTGIGNAFSNEILYAAKLSPYAIPANLTPEEVKRLYQATREVLLNTTALIRQEVGDRFPKKADRQGFLKVHNREGQVCELCGSKIAVIWKSKQSGTFYCPGCQAGGKEYNDRRFDKFLK
jgi:formamidopyrimidine-DNA glycosylase